MIATFHGRRPFCVRYVGVTLEVSSRDMTSKSTPMHTNAICIRGIGAELPGIVTQRGGARGVGGGGGSVIIQIGLIYEDGSTISRYGLFSFVH